MSGWFIIFLIIGLFYLSPFIFIWLIIGRFNKDFLIKNNESVLLGYIPILNVYILFLSLVGGKKGKFIGSFITISTFVFIGFYLIQYNSNLFINVNVSRFYTKNENQIIETAYCTFPGESGVFGLYRDLFNSQKWLLKSKSIINETDFFAREIREYTDSFTSTYTGPCTLSLSITYENNQTVCTFTGEYTDISGEKKELYEQLFFDFKITHNMSNEINYSSKF